MELRPSSERIAQSKANLAGNDKIKRQMRKASKMQGLRPMLYLAPARRSCGEFRDDRAQDSAGWRGHSYSEVESLAFGRFSEPGPVCFRMGALVSASHTKLTGWMGVLVRHLGDLVSAGTTNQWVVRPIPGDLVSKLIVRIYY